MSIQQYIPQYYVYSDGSQAGGFVGPHEVPEGSIEVFEVPVRSDQVWLFPGWGPSPSVQKAIEDSWRDAELVIIANQLDALEEAEVGEPPEDLLPGTRTQWLSHRGKVRNWVEGVGDFPDTSKRPTRP